MNTAAVEVSALCKRYRGFTLGNVSFRVPQGVVMGLIGPNGAGKTTIIKAIMNLIRRDGGRVSIFGMEIPGDEARIRSRIGFVYDTPCCPGDAALKDIAAAVAPFYPAWDQVLFRRLAEEFELPLRKAYKHLSHGQKTRFALALALCHDADLIVMDEPTAGLDPVFRLELLERLRGIMQNEGKTILFSTHITTDLERLADCITYVRAGEIVFSADMEEIREKWGIVRWEPERDLLSELPACRGVQRAPYGVSALTSELPEARRRLGGDVLIERASLEDIMFYIGKGEHHV